ncbi:MAG: hypothetical protein E7539_03000 [Ruminococcaceae bacterium]|nr:hypothetical protein [Oscillospiraceae bacterium]
MKKQLFAVLSVCIILGLMLSSCEKVIPNSSSDSVSENQSSELGGAESQTQSQGQNQSQSGQNQVGDSSGQSSSNKQNENSSDYEWEIVTSTASERNETSSKKQQSSQKPVSSTVSKPASSTTTTTSAATSSKAPVVNIPVTPISEDQYYGWKELEKKGTQAEKKAYKLFAEKFGNYQKEVTFDFAITKQEVLRAYEYYRDDYPQHFWRGNSYNYTTGDNLVLKFSLSAMLCGGDRAKIKAMDDKLNLSIDKVLSKIKTSMSLIERERFIHDYIINNCKYDTTYKAPNAHNMYGVFVDGTAVCEGYTYAFQHLARLVGIQCITVKGELNGYNGWESHAWNMVKLDGEYYHVDVTSDDPVISGISGGVLEFDYFNITEREVKKDHKISGNIVSVPSATATKYNFFNYYGLKVSSLTVDNFAKTFVFAANNSYKYASIKFADNISLNDAKAFLSKNYKAIVTKANSNMGKEVFKVTSRFSYMENPTFNTLFIALSYK